MIVTLVLFGCEANPSGLITESVPSGAGAMTTNDGPANLTKDDCSSFRVSEMCHLHSMSHCGLCSMPGPLRSESKEAIIAVALGMNHQPKVHYGVIVHD